MHEDHEHDHSQPTHSANCDACSFVAEVHAHNDDEAVDALAMDLADHNQTVHGTDTPPETIQEPIRAKLRKL